MEDIICCTNIMLETKLDTAFRIWQVMKTNIFCINHFARIKIVIKKVKRMYI